MKTNTQTETTKQRVMHPILAKLKLSSAAPEFFEALAKLKLYSAAPALLEALEWLVEFFDKYPPHFSDGKSMSVDLDDLNDARAAIAKATGKE